MGELINITTDGKGLSVVSARELYAFLAVKTKFIDWIKGRIIKYGFQQNVDYVEVGGFSENSEKGGRPQTDYALSLDMAKELSMVENNDRGKQARRYFINAEKALRQVSQPTVTTEQVMLQQAHALLSQQRQIDQLRSEVTQIMAGQRPNRRNRRSAIAVAPTLPGLELPALPAPHQRPPARSVRSEINQTIDAYCNRFNVSHSETWKYLYRRLQDVYRINVHRLVRIGQERTIDTLERYGHLDTLAKLIQAELVNRESS